MAQNNTIQSKYYSGQGIVLVSKLDSNGVPQGFRNIGNVADLKLALDVETLEHKESTSGQRATDLRLVKENKGSFSMMVENINKENLALGLRGTATAVAAASIAAENIIAHLGLTIPLANPAVSSVVVKGTDMTGSGGSDNSAITYVLDKNYTVNAETGSLNILSAAAQTSASATESIAEDDVLAIAYDFAPHDKIEALTEGLEYYALRFEGLNTADSNKAVVVDVYKISADPLKELALINDELAQISLDGSMLADTSRSSGSMFFTEKIVS